MGRKRHGCAQYESMVPGADYLAHSSGDIDLPVGRRRQLLKVGRCMSRSEPSRDMVRDRSFCVLAPQVGYFGYGLISSAERA